MPKPATAEPKTAYRLTRAQALAAGITEKQIKTCNGNHEEAFEHYIEAPDLDPENGDLLLENIDGQLARITQDGRIYPATPNEVAQDAPKEPPVAETPEGPEEPPADVPQDEIAAEYDKLIAEIRALRDEVSFWTDVLLSPYVVKFMEKMQNEIDQKKMDWEDIKPSAFMVSQARVQALSTMLRELKNTLEDAKAQLSSKLQLKASMLANYSLFLVDAEAAKEQKS